MVAQPTVVRAGKSTLQSLIIWQFLPMNLKSFLPLLPLLVLTGCTTAQFTKLTPTVQPRNADNLYPVEAAFDSNQQSLCWDSVKAYVIVNGQPQPMRPVPLVKNRWEGVIQVPPGVAAVNYHFKFDYLYNNFGTAPQPDSVTSKNYILKIKTP
jgi:hypothetical protein